MPSPYAPGDSFYGTIEPGVPSHLYVIISDPDPQGQVIVNLTSGTLNDRTCILQPGDHPYIRRESAVGYSWAIKLHYSQIDQAIKHGVWEEREPFNPAVIRRIQEGALISDDFPPKYVDSVRESLV